MTMHERLWEDIKTTQEHLLVTRYFSICPIHYRLFYPVLYSVVSYLIISRYLCLCLVNISVTVTNLRMAG